MKFKILCMMLFILVLMTICCINLDRLGMKSSFPDSVTTEMNFAVRDFKNDTPIKNARVVVIGADGKVIGVAVSDSQGIAKKEITTAIDRKYIDPEYFGTDNLLIRGSATAIIYCEGYLETILYNVGIALQSSYQLVYMKPISHRGRNEPDEQVGYSFRIDTCHLAEKYSKYAGKKVEY